jgi:hypothetical protein
VVTVTGAFSSNAAWKQQNLKTENIKQAHASKTVFKKEQAPSQPSHFSKLW